MSDEIQTRRTYYVVRPTDGAEIEVFTSLNELQTYYRHRGVTELAFVAKVSQTESGWKIWPGESVSTATMEPKLQALTAEGAFTLGMVDIRAGQLRRLFGRCWAAMGILRKAESW